MELKFRDCKIWFIPKSNNQFDVIKLSDNTKIGTVTYNPDSKNSILLDCSETLDIQTKLNIENTFHQYISERLESNVGNKVEVTGFASSVIEEYENLISGILKIRAYRNGKDPDGYQDYIDKVLNWIRSTDFYDAPASTRFHDSYKHGLLLHTLNVYNNMMDLFVLDKFKSVDVESGALCALVHDWCKINFYESYKRNVKNEVTGKWEQVDSYRCKNSMHPFGHGVASMYSAMRIFKLSEEEALAIRWHMGRWHVDDAYVNEFQYSNENYPLVHMLQFADQLAIVNY